MDDASQWTRFHQCKNAEIMQSCTQLIPRAPQGALLLPLSDRVLWSHETPTDLWVLCRLLAKRLPTQDAPSSCPWRCLTPKVISSTSTVLVHTGHGHCCSPLATGVRRTCSGIKCYGDRLGRGFTCHPFPPPVRYCRYLRHARPRILDALAGNLPGLGPEFRFTPSFPRDPKHRNGTPRLPPRENPETAGLY